MPGNKARSETVKRDVAVMTEDLAESHLPHPAGGGGEVADKMTGMERTQMNKGTHAGA